LQPIMSFKQTFNSFIMKTKLLFLAFLVSGISSLAQLDCSSVEYQHTTFENEYVELDTTLAISLTEGIVWDDPDLYFPIGFEFDFYDVTTSNLLVSGDLYGAAVLGNPDALKSAANAFLPAYADYTDLAYAEFEEGTENGISTISYLTEGEAGDRILKLQWKDVGFYNEVADGTANNWLNVQLWLYEADQSFEYRYGPSQINEEDVSLIFEELSSPVSGMICSLPLDDGPVIGQILEGSPLMPQLVEYDDESDDIPCFSSTPESGRVYRFERQIISVPELTENIEFSASPNPFNESITVTSDRELDRVSVVDMMGKVVFSEALQSKTLNIPTENLATGVYLLKVESKGVISTRKITKS